MKRESGLHFEFQFNPLTCTQQEDFTYVPWVAANGPFGFTPDDAPIHESNLYYENIFPNLFDDVSRRFFVGSTGMAGGSSCIGGFWLEPEAYRREKIAVLLGERKQERFFAPIAVYDFKIPGISETKLLLIQQGSYQMLAREDQPEISDGFVYLYRGIGESDCFNLLRYQKEEFNFREWESWKTYLDIQEASFSNSELSFAEAHSQVFRPETSHFMSPTIWRWGVCPVEIWDRPMSSLLRSFAGQQFSLRPLWVKLKFGPNFVKCRTPLHNLRMTSFFAGEEEVRLIDPNLLQVVEASGCKVQEISLTEASRKFPHGCFPRLHHF
jgi:hypothetical protein